MSLRTHAFVVVAVLLWQSFAMLGTVAVQHRAGELAHMAVHAQSLSHHHHADMDVHMVEDDSKPNSSAAQHQHTDSGVTPTGLLMLCQLAWEPSVSQSPAEAHQRAWLAPTLDGPLRPPKLRA